MDNARSFASASNAETITIEKVPPKTTEIQQKCKEYMYSFSHLYTRRLRGTTGPLQAVWFTLLFGGYGLSTWINALFVQIELQNVYFNALLFALSALPGNILSALLLDRLGRATLLVGSLVVHCCGNTLVFGAISPLLLPPDKARQAVDDGLEDEDNDNDDCVSGEQTRLLEPVLRSKR